MEEQLLTLSSDFQSATTMRMAASTQQAVRENAALQAEQARMRKETLRMRNVAAEKEQRIVELQRELALSRDLQRTALQQSRVAAQLVKGRQDVAHAHTQTLETRHEGLTREPHQQMQVRVRKKIDF